MAGIMSLMVFAICGFLCEAELIPLNDRFVVRLIIRSKSFTVDYANTSSPVHNSLKTRATSQVENMLSGSSGFISAEFVRFGPHELSSEPNASLMVEVEIAHSRAYVSSLEEEVKAEYKNPSLMFHPDFISIQHFNLTCPPPTVRINLTKTLEEAKVLRTDEKKPFHAELIDSPCIGVGQTRKRWEISKAEIPWGVFGKFLPRPLRSNATKFVLFQKSSKDSYLFVSYVLRHPVDNRIIAYDYGYALLLRPRPIAKITGVTKAIKGQGSVTLHASGALHSKDQNASLQFNWYCRRKEESFSEEDSFLKSSQNSGGCYGYGPGRLNETRKTLTVDVDKMEAGYTYVFRVKVTLDSETSMDDHYLTVFMPTSFTVRCTYNCQPKATVTKRTVIESVCSGPFCQMITRYQWSLHKTYSSNLKPAGPWIEVRNLKTKLLTELDGPNFVLKGKLSEDENSLEANLVYKARVVAFIGEEQVKEDEIIFKTNTAPFTYDNGGCTVDPSEGFALQTHFLFNCSGWHDNDFPLSYSFSYNSSKGRITISSDSTLPSLKTILPPGQKAEDYNVNILVEVIDVLGASSSDMLIVKVKPFTGTNHTQMMKKVVHGPNSLLATSLNKGDVGQATMTAVLVINYLNNENIPNEEKNMVQDTLLGKLKNVKPRNIKEVEQLSSFVTLATDERVDMPASALESSVQLLGAMTDYLTMHVDNESDYDRDVVQNVCGNVFLGCSNTITIAPSLEAANNDGDRFKQDVTENTLALIDQLGTTLLSTKVVGEEPSTFISNSMRMTLDRQKPSGMGNKTFVSEDKMGAVVLPSTVTLFQNITTSLDYVDAQLLQLKQNPYTWDASADDISSPVIQFELKTGEGSRLNISDLKNPFELFFPITKDMESGTDDSKDPLFVRPDGALRYHVVSIDSSDKIVYVYLQPQKNSTFEVFVSSGTRPTVDNYNFSARVPDFSSCSFSDEEGGYVNCTKNPFVFSFSSALTGQTGKQYVGIRLAKNLTASASKKIKRHAREARSCGGSTGRQKRSCIRVKDPPTTPPPTEVVVPKFNASTDVTYSLQVTLPSCVFWSETTQAWITKGCKLGPNTTSESLHCLCSHLSAFGGSIFVAPNPIDFDTVFIEFTKLAETKNYVVMCTVCAILGIYIIGLVFARRADRKDKLKVVANVLLGDSSGSTRYRYHITIQTGMWRGFGTTSRVGMIVAGKNGSSGVLALNDLAMARRLFSRASVNNFTLSVPKCLGSLSGVYVWHDNSGPRPAWFLQHIEITDEQTDEKWYFFANRWLALDKGAGITQLYLKVAEGKELTAFKPLFISRASRSLGEGHVWISVFTRPPHSSFTRCQRLTCCLSFLFTAMVTNAMFYQFDKPQTDTFKFGPLTVSWTQIKIGIWSSVICIPINVLLVFIFRNIREPVLPESDYVVNSDGNQTKPSGYLPPFFLYIAWAVALLVSLTGAFFTILYSMQWGAAKSDQWLTSILVSLVQDVLISQPIKVVAFATLLSLLIRKPPDTDAVTGPSFFKDKRGNKTKLCKPIQGQNLQKVKEQSIKRRKSLEAAKEMVTFVIFAILLQAICYGNEYTARYQITSAINDISGGFGEVVDKSSLWKWIEEALLPGLYDVTWYNGRPFKYEEGYVSNREEFMLGMPRLRQLRIKPDKLCGTDLIHFHFTAAFKKCRPSYSSSNEDRTEFNLPGWIPLSHHNQSKPPTNALCPEPWRYQPGGKILSLSHFGRFHTYNGGGYVASLGYNKQLASDVLSDLKEHEWVDESTAVVFVEFTLFNPSTSLFSFVRYTYEALPTGQAVTESDIKTLLLYPSTNVNLQSFKEVCQLLLLVFIVLCFIVEMIKFFVEKRYLRQVWNWVELLLLLVSAVAVTMSLLKAKYTSSYVKKVKENPYAVFSPDYIVRWAEQEILWLAAAIFILTLKLLHLIRFNRHICQMQGTLMRSARSVISFSFVFVIGIIAFSYFASAAFGSQMSLFSSLYDSFKANVLMSIGKQINYVELYLINSELELLFLFFHFLFLVSILVNIFIAIITDSYNDVREENGDTFEDAKLGSFMFANVSKQIQQLPSEVISSIKRLSKFKCSDLSFGNNAYKHKFKRGRRRHRAEEEAKCCEEERRELVPVRNNEVSLYVFHQKSHKTDCDTGREVCRTYKTIEEHHMAEMKEQLIGALAELCRYHAVAERDIALNQFLSSIHNEEPV